MADAVKVTRTLHHSLNVEGDLDAAIAELEAAAIPFARGVQGATVQIWFNDPAGNTVEIQQDTDVRQSS